MSNTSNWNEALRVKFEAGLAHAFILHLNINDYVSGTTRLPEYLSKRLAVNFDIVAQYDRAHGITFPVASMEDAFKRLVNPEGPNNSKKNDSILASLTGGGDDGDELPVAPPAALPLLETALRQSSIRTVVIINAAETLAPETPVGQMSEADRTSVVRLSSMGLDGLIADSGNMLILVTANLTELNVSVRTAKYESIALDLPNFDRRLSFIKQVLDADKERVPSSLEPTQMAGLTAGLSLVHIHDILLRAKAEGQLSIEGVKERKDEVMSSEYSDVLESLEPTYGFEGIGGLAHVKDFFQRNVIKPMREGNYRRVPMGVMMLGPAGTGKSAMALAVAKEAGINAVALNPARILGQYVGNSERNLEKALAAIKSLSPCIVFIDELDQTIQRGGQTNGDSGVGSRMFKRLLEFMADTTHRGKVVFLAASNRPDLIDAALRRPGRFDKKVPFLVPSEEERAGILGVMCARYQVAATAQAAVKVAGATNGWTGAELEAAAVKAGELVDDFGMSADEALSEAIKRLRPSTADIEYMTRVALREIDDIDLLPEEYKGIWSASQGRMETAEPVKSRKVEM